MDRIGEAALSCTPRPSVSCLERLSETDALQTAVINEGLRLSYGVTTRLPRVAPTEALVYKDWVIPPGVSQCICSHCQPIIT